MSSGNGNSLGNPFDHIRSHLQNPQEQSLKEVQKFSSAISDVIDQSPTSIQTVCNRHQNALYTTLQGINFFEQGGEQLKSDIVKIHTLLSNKKAHLSNTSADLLADITDIGAIGIGNTQLDDYNQDLQAINLRISAGYPNNRTGRDAQSLDRKERTDLIQKITVLNMEKTQKTRQKTEIDNKIAELHKQCDIYNDLMHITGTINADPLSDPTITIAPGVLGNSTSGVGNFKYTGSILPPLVGTYNPAVPQYTLYNQSGDEIHAGVLHDVVVTDAHGHIHTDAVITGLSVNNMGEVSWLPNFAITDHSGHPIETPLYCNLQLAQNHTYTPALPLPPPPPPTLLISNRKLIQIKYAPPHQAPELGDAPGGTVSTIATHIATNAHFTDWRGPGKRWFGARVMNHLFARNGKSWAETYEMKTSNYMTLLVGKSQSIKGLEVPHKNGKDIIDIDVHSPKYGTIHGDITVNGTKHPLAGKTISDLIKSTLFHHDLGSEKVRIYSAYNIFKVLYKMGVDQFGEMRYPDPNPPVVLPPSLAGAPGWTGCGTNFRCELIMKIDKEGNFAIHRRYINNLNYASYDEKTVQELNFKKNNKIDANFQNGIRLFSTHLHNIFESNSRRLIRGTTHRNRRRYNTQGSIMLRPARRSWNQVKKLRTSGNTNNRNFKFDFQSDGVKGTFDKGTITIEYEAEERSGASVKKVTRKVKGKNIENIINSTALFGKQIGLLQAFYHKMIETLYTHKSVYGGGTGKQYGVYDPGTNRYYTINPQGEMGYFVPQPGHANPIKGGGNVGVINPNSIPIGGYVRLDNSSDAYSTKIMTSKIDVMQRLISCMIDELSMPGGWIARRVRNSVRRLLR